MLLRHPLRIPLAYGFALLIAIAAAPMQRLQAEDHLPDLSGVWINTDGFTPDGLKGKVVYINYYPVATCPNDPKWWVLLNKSLHEMDGKPIVMIAVVTGAPLGTVQAWAKNSKVEWPVLVDSSGAVAAALDGKSGGGMFQSVSGWDENGVAVPAQKFMHDNFYETLLAVGKPHWKIDPATVPDALKSLWDAYEYSRWSKVATLLATTRPADDKGKAFVTAVTDGIKATIKERTEAAAAKLADGEKYNAYRLYNAVAVDFPQRPEAKEAITQAQKLRSDRVVTLETQAQDILHKARPGLKSDDKAVAAKAKSDLQFLIANYKTTDAAKTADSLLK